MYKGNKSLFFPLPPLHALIILILKRDVVQHLTISEFLKVHLDLSETFETWVQSTKSFCFRDNGYTKNL